MPAADLTSPYDEAELSEAIRERCPSCGLIEWNESGTTIPFNSCASSDIYGEWGRVARNLLRSPALVLVGWKQYLQACHIHEHSTGELGFKTGIRGTPLVVDPSIEFGVRVLPPIEEVLRNIEKANGYDRTILRNRNR